MTHRVIQWSTGNVGQYTLRAIVAHPLLELAGVWVHSDAKVGKDAAEHKLTFVTLYGIDEAKACAHEAAAAAKDALAAYAQKAWFLNALVDATVSRKS